MPRYTMRRCWPDDPKVQNDFQFCVDGKPAGRCYFMRAASGRDVWRWTVYGVSSGGVANTLADAQQWFKKTYEAAVKSPPSQ